MGKETSSEGAGGKEDATKKGGMACSVVFADKK